MNTHVGTHIEFPFHHVKGGYDAATFPLEKLVGEAIVLDISRWRKNNSRITLGEVKQAAGDRLRQEDIVYFYTGNDAFYRTDRQHERPWFTTDCIEWLAHEVKISVMGVDTTGHEIRNPDGSAPHVQPNHEALMKANVPLIECMTNLGTLLDTRFLTFILPVKVAGAEAFPVRVIGVTFDQVEAYNR
jgi:arylformamidase